MTIDEFDKLNVGDELLVKIGNKWYRSITTWKQYTPRGWGRIISYYRQIGKRRLYGTAPIDDVIYMEKYSELFPSAERYRLRKGNR